MRKLFIMAVAALGIGLSACTTTQTTQIENLIALVQAGAAQSCKFIPEVGTIIGIFNATVGATVTGIVSAICATVPPPSSGRYKALPRYAAGLNSVQTGNVGIVPVTGWRTQ